MGSKTARASVLYWIDPKRGGTLVALDVDVRRLRAFGAVEEKARWA